MALKLITPASVPCLTLDEAKLHLRVDGTAEDDLIKQIVMAAQGAAERIMGRAIMPQTWRLSLDAFPTSDAGVIKLLKPPVSAVSRIAYVDQSDALLTLDPSQYRFYPESDLYGLVGPALGAAWPKAASQPQSVRIDFTAGYESANAVPDLIKAWIKLRVGTLYEQREDEVLQYGGAAKLTFADFMLDDFVVRSF